MDEKNESNLQMAEKDASLNLLFLIGVLFLLLSIISCSSRDPADKSSDKETADGIFLESVKIKGVMISVGDSADAVYGQIGMGIRTVATNDPANQGSIIIFRAYESEDKTYRIAFCKEDKEYFHVCRISRLKSPLKTGVGTQSEVERNLDAERYRRRDNINDSRRGPKIFTNDDLKKKDINNN